MAESSRTLKQVRWSINEDLYAWFAELAERLHTNPSALIRMFLLQLKEGEPLTRKLLNNFIEAGMREALLKPKVAKIFLERELHAWLADFLRDFRHPSYPQRRVVLRHLLSGYALYLQRHETECVRYGSIRLEECH